MLGGPHEIEALVALRREQMENELARRQTFQAVVQGPAWWRKRLGGLLQTTGAILVFMGERMIVDEGNLVGGARATYGE